MQVTVGCIVVALWSCSTVSCAATPEYGPTFGRGVVPQDETFCKGASGGRDTVLLDHKLSPGSTHGVLHYFWVTGKQLTVDRVWISYYIDGETVPSIRFQPAMMCGVAFPSLLMPDQYFDAGLCGRSAPAGGFHNSFLIPFQKSVVVTVAPDTADGDCLSLWINVRGTENLPLVLPGTQVPLPLAARLQLQRGDMATRQPSDDVVLAELAPGQHGALFMTSFAVEAQPKGGAHVGGGYIEGCWHFYGTNRTAYPGLIVGTGVEDYFNSAWYFGVDSFIKRVQLYSTEQAGLTIFDRNEQTGLERLSAYRIHTKDPLFFTDGGQFAWKVGVDPTAGRTKCGEPKSGGSARKLQQATPHRSTDPVKVTTYAWVYIWQAEDQPPAFV